MAIRPDWTSGTLTLVAGSKDFTTTGSALETAALQAGDAIITVSGYVLIIETITGQNSGTLVAECPVAAAGGDQPLRIRYQPDGSRVQGAMRMVRELLTSGNLEAFAALAGEEDAVPVFVGPGVIKLVPKSELGLADPKGNLAELAALTKANEQFVVMGADGKIAIVPFKQFTDEIAKKYQLPENGTEQQLLSGTGGLIDPSALPVSIATQDALDLKASTALVGTKSSYNWIINGDFTINQRGGVKFPADGTYGYDRWKRTGTTLNQKVEALPAGEYTLTWSGGGQGFFGGVTAISPIKATVQGGNADIYVPPTATRVSLVAGDASGGDPWSTVERLRSDEILLCLRYFRNYQNVLFGPLSSISGDLNRGVKLVFDVPLRTTPTATYLAHGDTSNITIENGFPTSVVARGTVANSAVWGGLVWFKLDAEL
ncbi:hypothetical protein KQ944_07815 [Bacillus subtilis]|uniref:hypothetical protein n=1 Tax=Pseudochrobactrum asaccharolyticum TaxID=354351 RepID=UPI001F36AB74|nr:hypothetical protein [Pseudochrobactrum asaccharolyticum]MCF7645044.1 hypothetical protein [Pseudochrobactrum asaccharolyticum]MCF7671529.1 hypothetical protein [Bacillus subtilis]